MLKRLGREILTMKRHATCDEDQAPVPWYRTPRAIHYSVMAGFLGLFTASGLDFIFIFFLGWGWFPPSRVLGTISGLLMLYGVSSSLYQRYRGKATYLTSSTLSDWWLLAFLLVLALTGFWLETAVSFGWAGPVNDTVLLIHTTMAMELVLLVMVDQAGARDLPPAGIRALFRAPATRHLSKPAEGIMTETKNENIVYVLSQGTDHPEMVLIAFTHAVGALAMEVEARLVLIGPAVNLAQKGAAKHVKFDNLKPMDELLANFLEMGGQSFISARRAS